MTYNQASDACADQGKQLYLLSSPNDERVLRGAKAKLKELKVAKAWVDGMDPQSCHAVSTAGGGFALKTFSCAAKIRSLCVVLD